MKTHITKHVVVLCSMLLAAGVGLSSCYHEPVSAPVGDADFSSIRIMNFAECNNRPYDIYVYRENSADSVIFHALPYGVGGAYATNLPPGIYTIELRRLNLPGLLDTIKVEVSKGAQKTAVLWPPPPGGVFPELDTLLSDRQVVTKEQSSVYVRFLNTKNSIEAVRVAIDNPLNDAIVDGVLPRKMTEYYPLKHVLDTSYAIYLTKPGEAGKHEIISCLAGATFSPGNFYTVILGGNEGDCRDTSAIKADTLRIRYFDDNAAGNELTFPVPQSLRFNFVNGLINPPVLQEDSRTYERVGVTINNDDRYLISEMTSKKVAPVTGSNGTTIETGFYTIPWTEAILLSMYKKDGLRGQSRGTKLVDARVGNRREVFSDQPFSIVICDTVNSRIVNGFPAIDSLRVNTFAVPLPVVAHPDSITLVLVNGLASHKIPRQPGSEGTSAKFTINGITPSFWNTPQTNKKYSWYTIGVKDVSEGKITVVADIGRTATVQTLMREFVSTGGGVYEIVLIGQRENTSEQGKPDLLILHTNPKSQK